MDCIERVGANRATWSGRGNFVHAEKPGDVLDQIDFAFHIDAIGWNAKGGQFLIGGVRCARNHFQPEALKGFGLLLDWDFDAEQLRDLLVTQFNGPRLDGTGVGIDGTRYELSA